MERYADIVLPLAQPAYTFAVADGLDVEEGQAVAVQFGARRIYTGIVWRLHDRRPDFKTGGPTSPASRPSRGYSTTVRCSTRGSAPCGSGWPTTTSARWAR